MADKTHSSVIQIWEEFLKVNPDYKTSERPNSWYFCDTKEWADKCAQLVIDEIKQGTCSLYEEYKTNNEALPKVGQLDIITNWEGEAKAIIKISKIEKIPFNEVSEELAAKEGEGDRTLTSWRKGHWDFFKRQTKSLCIKPSEDMILVYEHFETIWINQ